MKWIGAIAAGLVLTGCEEHNTCEVAGSVDPTLEIGTGEDAFTSFEDELPVQYGSQGGQHVWVSVRTTGIVASKADQPTVTAWLEADGESIGEATAWEPIRGDETGAEVHGIALQFSYDFEEEPAQYVLRVEAEDACGTVVEDSREIELAW